VNCADVIRNFSTTDFKNLPKSSPWKNAYSTGTALLCPVVPKRIISET